MRSCYYIVHLAAVPARLHKLGPWLRTAACTAITVGLLQGFALAQDGAQQADFRTEDSSQNDSSSTPVLVSGSDSDISLDSIEVIGEVPYRTGDVISEESTSSHSRVERVDLTQSPRALASVLARESGVQHRQSGGFGSFSSLSIRAATGAQTAVYLDGVLLNNGGNPVVDFSTLEMLNLDSVDIYRGSTPMQLGHAAIGGAVNLNSLLSTGTDSTTLRLSGGSLSQAGLQLSHQSQHKAWDIATAFSHRQSDNDFLFTNNNGTPLNANDDRRERRHNADASRSSALLRTGYQHSDDARTDLTVQLSDRNLGVPDWRNNPDNVASYQTQTSQFQVSQVWDTPANWNSRHNAYWHRDSSHYQDLLSQVGLGSQDSTSKTHTFGAKSYWEHLGDTGTTGLSLELRRESLTLDDPLDTANDFDARRLSTLGVMHYVWFSPSESWSITPSLRWQNNQLDNTQSSEFSERINESNHSNTGLQLGAAYHTRQQLSFSANAGSYYREPAFGELYGSIGLIDGNPDLLPEKGINIDMGAHYRTERLNLEATLFASERDELIVTAFDARGVGKPLNTGRARVLGLELASKLAVTPQLDMLANFTWQSPKSLDSSVSFHNKFLPGEAQLAWFTRVQYRRSRSTFWYEFDLQQKRYYDRANLLPAADTEQHSIGLDWVNGHWQASLSIQNLGDNNFEDFNGFPKPGRTWSLAVSRAL